MRNGCTLTALVSGMLNIINETVIGKDGSGHMWIGVVLAVATLVAIFNIDLKRNGEGDGNKDVHP